MNVTNRELEEIRTQFGSPTMRIISIYEIEKSYEEENA